MIKFQITEVGSHRLDLMQAKPLYGGHLWFLSDLSNLVGDQSTENSVNISHFCVHGTKTEITYYVISTGMSSLLNMFMLFLMVSHLDRPHDYHQINECIYIKKNINAYEL